MSGLRDGATAFFIISDHPLFCPWEVHPVTTHTVLQTDVKDTCASAELRGTVVLVGICGRADTRSVHCSDTCWLRRWS